MKITLLYATVLITATQLFGSFTLSQNNNVFKSINSEEMISPKMYESACKNGSANSCYELGFIYNAGKGVTKDYKKAHEYYQIACDAGYARACTRLGLLYGEGKGVEKDFKKAMSLYKKACEGDHFDGCTLYNAFK